MAIEFLLVISMLIVVFLLMLQYAVRAHAQRITTAAAHQGLAAATSYRGTVTEAQATAIDYLTRLGPGLTGSHVTATRTATTASVTITGHATQLIPFLPVTVHVHVEGPVEHFVPTPDQPTTPAAAPVGAGP